MQQSSLNQSLQIDLDKIPSMPYALLQLLEIIHDPEVSFPQITEIIQSDPALTTRVMSIANSGAYYQWNKYKDFNRLLVALGLKMVTAIAMNSTVQQYFSQFNVDNEGELGRFWQTSLTTACIARKLAHVTGYHHEDEAYIAGLLCKVGELVCLIYNVTDYVKQKAQQINESQAASLYELEFQQSKMEREFIGASIPEIGARIIHGFDQDSMLGDAILFQREPAEKIMTAPHLVQVINMAHKLALLNNPGALGVSATENYSSSFVLEKRDNIFKEVSQIFGLNQALLEEILETSHAEFLDTAKKMGISINDNVIELDNKQIQMALAENVRTIALSSSLQQINTCRLEQRPEQELIEQMMQNLRLLFGLSCCIFLTYDEQSRQLSGQPVITSTENISEQLLAQFSLSLDVDTTVPVQALVKNIPVSSQDYLHNSSSKKDHSENGEKTVLNGKKTLDKQLLSLLATEEMLCLPLFDKKENRKYGVLVAGISANRLQKVRCEKGLLYEFTKAASEIITRDRNIAEQLHTIIEEEKTLYALEIRNLVHEANNPLGVIRNYLQVLSYKLSDSQDEKLQGQLAILMSEVERVGNIVLRIRETPINTPGIINQVDINLLINELLLIFKESLFLKSGITVKIKLDSSIPLIQSNTNSLKQILTNLFKNATEAMTDGGEINISTRDQVNFNGEQFIELKVSDSGFGIPDEIINNLFNPVKSTKSEMHSGLGLSIIKNLVNDLGGTIGGSNRYSIQGSSVLQKQVITGAEFIILLPRILIEK